MQKWFNTECFQRLTLAANAGQIGDDGRNTVRGPGLVRTDLSLFKNFNIVRDHRLQLRVEAFNLFNQARFGQPGFDDGLADVWSRHRGRGGTDRAARREVHLLMTLLKTRTVAAASIAATVVTAIALRSATVLCPVAVAAPRPLPPPATRA